MTVKNNETVNEVKENLENQLKDIDKKIESAAKRVDKLSLKRGYVAELLEKVNRIDA